VFYICLE